MTPIKQQIPWNLRPLMLCAIVWSKGQDTLAADWTQYRGPNHDGSNPEVMRTDWNARPPRVMWKRAIDPAWSSITVQGNRAFTQGNRRIGSENREVCIALDADTGTEVWAANLGIADYPDAGTGSLDGPRSTPTVHGNRVYVLTSYLALHCLDAGTGRVLWRRDFPEEFPGTRVISWQNAASPLLAGDRIYLNSNVGSGSLTAIRASDGVTVWNRETDRMTHATPTWATLDGIEQVLFLTSRGLVGVVPDSGNVLWRYAFTPSGTSTAATPIATGGYVYASCAYALGAWTAKVGRSATDFSVTATDFKRNNAHQNHWSTPVAHEGFIYGIVESGAPGRTLACLSLESRLNRWTTRTVGGQNPGFASVIKVGGTVVVLTEQGRLVLVAPNPDRYEELGQFQALTGKTWNHPAYANGRLYARSVNQIVALEVEAARPVVPPIGLAIGVPASPVSSVALEVSSLDGTPLTEAVATQLRVETTPTLEPVPAWSSVPATFRVDGTRLRTEVPLAVSGSSQFLRVRSE
ncbi:MAG: alcohol dehydrogenase [Verrucomicrobia bacterium]|nr:alcohol dehydrogenase [Verrucomicrobiota bacterium]